MDKQLVKLIKRGDIFIYPTDTVYGIGCNALNKKAVAKIKKIKGRDWNKPFSIIVPNKSWIFKHTKASKKIVDKYLPGKYTLILEKKKPRFLKHVSPNEMIGVRIPKHYFTKLIEQAKVPFITTSANTSGNESISDLKNLEKSILEKADIIINGGKLCGKPSTLILNDETQIKR